MRESIMRLQLVAGDGIRWVVRAARRSLFPSGKVPLVSKEARLAIGIYTGTSPTDLAPAKSICNPVLTASSVTDAIACGVADPFMVQHSGRWYMFFEVIEASGKGRIGLATSPDAITWRYERIVLAEKWHLSYPCVFSWQNEFYLVPESGESRSLLLYRAYEFPFCWKPVCVLLEGDRFVDPTIFPHEDYLYLMVCTGERRDTLRLYISERPDGVWVEHPCSPVAHGNYRAVRPGGRAVLQGQRIVRYAQSNAPSFAHSVWALEIERLTPHEYAEKPLLGKAILGPSGQGWNADGMHHVDLHQVGPQEYLACVDGHVDRWHLRIKL